MPLTETPVAIVTFSVETNAHPDRYPCIPHGKYFASLVINFHEYFEVCCLRKSISANVQGFENLYNIFVNFLNLNF